MIADDAPMFFQRLAGLSELFDAKFSDAKSELYFEALRDLSLVDVLWALNEATKRCKFMPRPVEIRDLAIGDIEDLTERAWQTWKTAARRLGSYRTFETDDTALADTLVSVFGGWPEACVAELSPEMWVAKRKEFGRVYQVFKLRGEVGHRGLAGHFERERTQHTFPSIREPQRITGDTDDGNEG